MRNNKELEVRKSLADDLRKQIHDKEELKKQLAREKLREEQ